MCVCLCVCVCVCVCVCEGGGVNTVRGCRPSVDGPKIRMLCFVLINSVDVDHPRVDFLTF